MGIDIADDVTKIEFAGMTRSWK